MTELEKLLAKRKQIEDEIILLRPEQVRNSSLMTRVIQLSTMLCDCDKYIANIRVNANNK